MEYWLENQGQHQLYSRFGTLPGRNCAHNYHDRQQPAYNTLCYGEQRDQGRATSNWTVPGSRAGGALQEYTHWAEPELPSSPSPHFPFVLHRHNQRHQDLGEYRQHDPRDRERRAPHGAVRDHDRGSLRDPWPKRWDQSQPSCYRDAPAKRNDSSYRELEAWAARYSHSLPRRRRLEAELQQAIQGLSESSWTPEREKPMTNPRVQPQHGQLNPNRASGQWDAAAPPAADTNLMKEKIEYQSRGFGKPPGYIGPPPYNGPPVMHHRDVGWQQVGKTRADWSQPTLRKQDVPVDLQTKGEAEQDESKIYPEMEELKSSKPDGDAFQTASPIDAQTPESVLAQEPQAVQSSSMRRDEICKVLEGRKFSVKKKTGGMTIFCLVSRIASPSETASLPVCASQTSVQSTETDISEPRQDSSQMKTLADDVDLGAQTLKEQSDKTAIRCRDKVMPEDKLPSSVFLEESGVEGSVPASVQPVLMKYPLWREPGASSKAEADSSDPNCSKETTRSTSNQNEGGDVSSHSTDNEQKKLDIAEDAEDLRGLLVIDTSCVVVKVELIPSPKKEHVHYLGSTANEESSSSDSNSRLYQDVTADPSNETPSGNEDPDADLDPSLLEKPEHEESDASQSGGQPSLLSERETLQERAERILGIPLQDAAAEQQTEDEEPPIDLCKEKQMEEAGKPPSEQTLEDATDHVEALQAEKDRDDIRKQVTNEDDQEQQAT
ncbi:uncharacterized protein si:ch211-159e12.5 [Fundulus heteroclitus]|uniref:uncharacterized protein si:ch211-159e12.5 n=1 Tax=Fundulus heteroclitus TaxID=8078 RepID=UPI00165ACEB8|nr:uncharacterized protein si:ch211-159e12.5 [Fundulus heteroclitus]